MSKTITINGTDRTSVVRLAGQVWAEVAERGAVGIGGLDLSDEGGAITVPAMKAITVDESAASPVRLFTGYTAEPGIARGPYRVGTDRSWDVDVFDINTLLDDRLLLAGANRPEETDHARVTWLLTTTAMTGIGVTAGVVPNTNTVTMDAVDYRGATPRRVLDECAEMAGKNFFLYRYSSGPLLYYDLESGTSLTSTARFSTVAADVDSATTWAVAIESHTQDTGRIYSRLRMTYANGSVWVTNASTASTYRTREISFTDKSIKTEAKAVVKANKYLAAAALPTERFTLMVRLPAANVNDIRAGQRAEVKIPHLGISSFTYYRCVRREIGPAGNGESVSDVMYDVRLEFAKNAYPTRFREQHTEDENTGIGGGGNEVDGSGGGYGDGGSGPNGCDDCDPYDPNSSDCDPVTEDDFNRSETGQLGGNWTTLQASASGITIGVDGAQGFVESNLSKFAIFGLPAGGSWATGDFEMTAQFLTSVVNTSGLGFPLLAFQCRNGAFGNITAEVTVQFGQTTTSWPIAVTVSEDHGDVSDTAVKALSANTSYNIRWNHQGALSRVKVWATSGSEPAAWDATIDRVSSTAYATDNFLISVATGGSAGHRIEWDNLVFVGCGGPSAGQDVPNESIVGVDGIADTFYTLSPYKSGGMRVYVDGIDVSSSVTEDDPATGQFSLDFVPESDESMVVTYRASGREITGETVGGGDGSETIFETEHPYAAGSLTVYVDGVDTAVTETSPTAGTFTFGAAPAADTIITADYRKQ